jgi:hypothetical protein
MPILRFHVHISVLLEIALQCSVGVPAYFALMLFLLYNTLFQLNEMSKHAPLIVEKRVNLLLAIKKLVIPYWSSKNSTSLLFIGLKFYFLLIILVLKLENKYHFCPW